MTTCRPGSLLSLFVVAAATVFTNGCGSPAALTTDPGDGKTLNIGFIYVGSKSDFGYNQAHAEGALAVKKLGGVHVSEDEKVAETVDVQKTMKSMIEMDKATLVFATSFGYFEPHVVKMAREYPNVTFLHCGGLWSADKHPSNVGTYFGYIDECEYLSGIVAGHMTRSKKLGFVAAKPIAQVLRNINAFMLGARSVNPAATCTVIFTGDWCRPVAEAEATNTLIDGGVDVITCHVDSPKVVMEVAERRGIYSCGYHCSQAPLAPKGYLTGAEWNWGKVYTDFVKEVQAGRKPQNMTRGGLREGIVKTSPYGPAVSAEAKKAADATKARFMEGKFVIFKGPLNDNTGAEILPKGKELTQTDIELETMNYLVEGVIGNIGE